MPNLEDLNLDAESTPQVDWDAPEGGTMPPQVSPGTYTFKLKMPDDTSNWFDAMDYRVDDKGTKKKFLIIMAEPQLVGDKDGQPYGPPEGGGELPTLKFQRFSMFKNDKMVISSGAEFLRSLGIRILSNLNPETVREQLRTVDGRQVFKGDVKWDCYFKSTETTVSTNPSRKRGDFPWPKEADGTFSLMVSNPKNPNDQKQYGRAQIYRTHEVKVG